MEVLFPISTNHLLDHRSFVQLKNTIELSFFIILQEAMCITQRSFKCLVTTSMSSTEAGPMPKTVFVSGAICVLPAST